MDLNQFRAQLATDLQAGFPAPVGVKTHPGRFDLGELEAYAVEAPCIRVALLSSADTGINVGQEDSVEVGAYLIAKKGKSGAADTQLLAMATLLRIYIRGKPNFGGGTNQDAAAPMNIKFVNLYTGSLGEIGQVALGAVTWTQRLDLPDLTPTTSLADFLTFDGQYELGPDGTDIVAEGITSLPQ